MTKAVQHKHSKERHQKWAKEASAKRFDKNAITFGEAWGQVLSAGEQVDGLPLYKVSRKAVELIATAKWKERA